MKTVFCLLIGISLLCVCPFEAKAQKKKKENVVIRTLSPVNNLGYNKTLEMEMLVNKAAQEALKKFADKGFKEENLSITLIDLSNPQIQRGAGFRDNEKIYPASVVKMFYLVALHRWLEDGKIKMTDELNRAMREMIVDSWNEPTQYIVDVLTRTTSGPELPPKEMKDWAYKRNAVNRYFTSLGFENINVCQKTYCEDAYGREQVFRDKGKNRNMLTTDAVARLLSEIVMGQAVTKERSAQMMELMKRDYESKATDPEDQAHGFTAIALPPGMKLWSKAGWTSTTRHDAAYIEMPNGVKFVLVTFTTNFANEKEIIPTVARVVIDGIRKINY
jgi:beta-lactamase class A